MGSFQTFEFQLLLRSGTGPNFTYTSQPAAQDAITDTWTETEALPDSTHEFNDPLTEPNLGAATYLGQFKSPAGDVYHLIFQNRFYLLAPYNPDAPKFDGSFTTNDLQIYVAAHCFATGTAITTPKGEVAVETLEIGDSVLTADGSATRVLWIGRQATPAQLMFNPRMEPVRIRKGALGDGLPRRDLTVSADHGMMIAGMVINASALVNHDTIDFVPSAELEFPFTYYHIETEDHDVILAEGAASETYLDIPGRQAFDNYQEYLDLYGAERIVREMDAPRITSRRLLPDAIKARLGIVEPRIDWDVPLMTA